MQLFKIRIGFVRPDNNLFTYRYREYYISKARARDLGYTPCLWGGGGGGGATEDLKGHMKENNTTIYGLL